MSESELLPCPFCGAQAFGPYIAHGDIPAEHYLNHYQVACSDQSHCGAVVTGGRLKTKADAVKHWNKAHQAIAATVAAALAELRTQWNAQYQDYVSKTDDSSWERRQELLDRMRELDAIIAKLDLAICYEDRLPETLTDEQYNQWHASSWVQDGVRVGVSIEAAPASCTWTPDDDGNYVTGCDGLFVILEGTPAENQMAYCCYCGKPIKEQPK